MATNMSARKTNLVPNTIMPTSKRRTVGVARPPPHADGKWMALPVSESAARRIIPAKTGPTLSTPAKIRNPASTAPTTARFSAKQLANTTVIPSASKKRTSTEAGLAAPESKKKQTRIIAPIIHASNAATLTAPAQKKTPSAMAPSSVKVCDSAAGTAKAPANQNATAKPQQKRITKKSAPPPTNLFMKLPTEIRNKIYGLIGILRESPEETIHVGSIAQQGNDQSAVFRKSSRQRSHVQNLMRTCRPIREEVGRIIYSGNFRLVGQAFAKWIPSKFTAQHISHLTIQLGMIDRIARRDWKKLANAKYLDRLKLEISHRRIETISVKDVTENMKEWALSMRTDRKGLNMRPVLKMLEFGAVEGATVEEQKAVEEFGSKVREELRAIFKSTPG
ncbi:uncharacterized protein MYCFIDRAFT_76768 [Pseudocercospora fijiensis CIRAD86]|uniref:Uncharacterized protein n=1 Tax=Pseudocercospora fijiensis (strain CIRAD86) TaxID=383855 RepID=N1QBF5_PSEFD|nr:uncharacterized protein MYCFIDRAFT_76768 [Pseudocercospora fijiensis CIRAD86]EME89431.1 hypothetical protein MYCFIDRAFT_76768 [Pseudocercospora fijiensis CIRAD86]